MSQMLTFRRFSTAAEAADVLALLQQHHIPAEYDEEVILLDKSLVGQNFDPLFLIKIPAEYFTSADRVIRDNIKVVTGEVDPDYYLLSFSKEELMEVVIKKDDWGEYDYVLALQLLEEKGVTFTTAQLDNFNNARKHELAKPEDGAAIWIVIGYLSALLAGLLGIFIGAFFFATKKTLPDGNRVFAYTEQTRKHGRNILITGISFFIIWVALAFMGVEPPQIIPSLLRRGF